MNAWLDVVIAVLLALIGREGIGALVRAWSAAKAENVTAEAAAHDQHASAASKEVQARLSLDTATRAWAARLIERYDQENAELRGQIEAARAESRRERAALESKHAQDRAVWDCQLRELQKELDALRRDYEALKQENATLRVLLERCGLPVGTGPLSPSILETHPPHS